MPDVFMSYIFFVFFFFFQAEDGIRDDLVTGVQTCALPISCAPVRRWRAAKRQSPVYVALASASRGENAVRLYCSRASESTAFGPAITVPSTRFVRWTPRNGKLGSGTG